MIKAIETIYNGYRFRSRLEARWAVFFDALKIPYFYEHEGYDCGGTLYLPDFYLPQQDCFIEVKGAMPDKKEEEKAYFLAEASEKDVYIFWGEIPTVEILEHAQTDSAFGYFTDGGWDNNQWWCECFSCGAFGISFDGRSDRLPCHRHTENPCPSSAHGDKGYNYASERLAAAYQVARFARFEHGETPFTAKLRSTLNPTIGKMFASLKEKLEATKLKKISPKTILLPQPIEVECAKCFSHSRVYPGDSPKCLECGHVNARFGKCNCLDCNDVPF